MVDIPDVSLDWLFDCSHLETEKGMMKQIEEVIKMKRKEKEHDFVMPYAFIAKTQIQDFLIK